MKSIARTSRFIVIILLSTGFLVWLVYRNTHPEDPKRAGALTHDQRVGPALDQPEPGKQTRICFSDDGDIWVSGLRGEHPQKVAADGEAPQWSPDGQQIAYQGLDGGIFIVDVRTANSRRLSIVGKRPHWSPDGQKLCFLDDQENIHIISSDGTGDRKVGDSPHVGVDTPKWTRDSQGIYAFFSREVSNKYNPDRIVRISIQGGETKEIGIGSGGFACISPDEKEYALLGTIQSVQEPKREMSLGIGWIGPSSQPSEESAVHILYTETIVEPKEKGFFPNFLSTPVWSPSGRLLSVIRDKSPSRTQYTQDVLLFGRQGFTSEFSARPTVTISDKNVPWHEKTPFGLFELAWAESNDALIVSAVQSRVFTDALGNEIGNAYLGMKALTRRETSDESVLALDRLLLVENISNPSARKIIDIGSGHSADVWEPWQP